MTSFREIINRRETLYEYLITTFYYFCGQKVDISKAIKLVKIIISKMIIERKDLSKDDDQNEEKNHEIII